MDEDESGDLEHSRNLIRSPALSRYSGLGVSWQTESLPKAPLGHVESAAILSHGQAF